MTNIDIKQRMQHYHVTGLSFSLIEDGQISESRHFGCFESGSNNRVDAHTLFNACSISKFLTALLAMRLVEQNYLHLDEDVNNQLLSWKVPDNHYTKIKKVTLRNLLCHQAGIKDPRDSFSALQLLQEQPTMVEILNGQTPYCSIPIEVSYEPESEFHYSDAGFCIIQQLIEDVTGKPFHLVVDEFIFTPLHMKNSLFATNIHDITKNVACGHHKNGELVLGKYPIYPYLAACGLWTTTADLAKLVLELMHALKGTSNLGISVSHIKELIHPQGCKEWTGLGVFIEGAQQEIEMSSLGWGVGFQCMIVAYPYREKGLVIMTNTDLGVHQMEGLIGEIYKSLLL
ncbi:serine hydrolase domain-containing protein [Lysinibacillus sphaericus]|uniref:Beta-lactamase n=1 Tax=Lysinibacillus sphaericus OT4b.31 TaxID=1285586 RepID=R7ZED2_LYSSH|nr:serine hydrolase domain-containing protein [Lysinibacillus sphaericus]EON72376.1 beta-lactamase [Lysinibacillus sphaericus OT4b.31]